MGVSAILGRDNAKNFVSDRLIKIQLSEGWTVAGRARFETAFYCESPALSDVIDRMTLAHREQRSHI